MINVFVAPRSRVRTLVEDVVTGSLRRHTTVHQVTWQDCPQQADIVVTGSAISRQVETFAARRGTAKIAVLPEAYDWLRTQFVGAADTGRGLVVVDAAFATVDPLAVAR